MIPEVPESTVILKRRTDDGKETLGSLTAVVKGKTFSCVTLELPWKENKHNISCIPKGKYKCVWSFMPSHNVWHYLLQNVPGRDGIFIHSASIVGDLRGCLALGVSYADFNRDGEQDIVNSRKVITDFETLLGKKDFYLTIS